MDNAIRSEVNTNTELQHYNVIKELGDCYTSAGEYEKAKNCYERASVLGPDEAGPYVGLGVIAFQNDLLDDADIAFRVACRLDNKCSQGWAGRAMVAQKKNEFERAFELYLKCLELNVDNLTALLGLFQVSCQMGSFSKVIYYLQAYLDMHPGDTSVMFSLAALYMKDSQLEKSSKILKDILALEPDNKEAADLFEEVEYCFAKKQKETAVI